MPLSVSWKHQNGLSKMVHTGAKRHQKRVYGWWPGGSLQSLFFRTKTRNIGHRNCCCLGRRDWLLGSGLAVSGKSALGVRVKSNLRERVRDEIERQIGIESKEKPDTIAALLPHISILIYRYLDG